MPSYLFITHFEVLMTCGKKALWNFVGKGENVGNQYFTLCPQCLLLFQRQIQAFYPCFTLYPNNKTSDKSKLKSLVDDKRRVIQKLKFVSGKGRKHCWKRRKCWLPEFSPFLTMFSNAFFSEDSIKLELCGKVLLLHFEITSFWIKSKIKSFGKGST